MASSILSVGQSALAAAQVGLTTTGHNIANANTPGYSRQVVVQTASTSQDTGVGFIGKGTEVASISRVYDDYLGNRVLSAQTSQNELGSYYAQIKQVNNMFADSTVGLTPTLQDFFKSVQNLASAAGSGPARQSLLSSSETLAAQFKSLDGQLNEMRDGVNTQINASIGNINNYAQQIAKLNDAIEKAQAGNDGRPANDLLDQRDQAVSELSKEIKVNIVKQNDSYSVFIGNGQPLVVGTKTFNLVPSTSATDLSRAEVGYVSNGQTITLAENAIAGGKLGGLFDFRSKTLDVAQNSLGRIAIGLASTVNDQHKLGQDQNGKSGGTFFNVGSPVINPSTANTGAAQLAASISDVGALTTSDYQVQWDGKNYNVTRLSDGIVKSSTTLPLTVDGVDFSITGTPATGDIYLVKPTVAGAAGFNVAITDTTKIAAALPIRAANGSSVAGGPIVNNNVGSGQISAGSVNAPPPPDPNLQQPVTITFTSPTTFDVTGTGIPASATGLSYTPGGNISYNGWTVQIAGNPANGDTFTIGPNTNGVGDNRNLLEMAKLQTSSTLDNGNSNLQSAYGQLVNQVGNKTHELEVTSSAAGKLLDQAVQAQQSNSGVNLDEEATNLLRYQQAYAAAGKVMQTASKLFDVLLSLGQ